MDTCNEATPGARDAGGRRDQIIATVILVGCLTLGVVIRAFAVGIPVTGIRDTHTASITRNLMRDGVRGLLKPRVNYPGDQPGYLALEFPILNGAQALTARFAPWAGEAAFRIPSLLAYVLGALCLIDFARRRLGEREACFALALMTFFPVQISTSVSLGPDQAAVSLALLALAALDRFLVSNRLSTLSVAAVALSSAILVKPPILIIALPCAVLVITRCGWRAVWRPRLVTAAALAIVPMVGWMIHSRHLNATSKLGWATASELVELYLSQRGRLNFYFDPGWYRSVGDNLVIGFTAAGIAAAVLGLVVAVHRRVELAPVLVAWLGALLFYVFFLPFHLATHKYYVLPFAPLIALLGGLFLALLSRQTTRLRSTAGWVAALVVVVTVAASVPSTVRALKIYPGCRVVFGEMAQKCSSADQLIVTAAPGMRPYDGVLLYRADRRGWKLRLQPSRLPRKNSWKPKDAPTENAEAWGSYWTRRSVAELEMMRQHGASVIGILGKKRHLKKTAPGFMAYLEEHYVEVARNKCCVFFDISSERGVDQAPASHGT